MEVVGGPADCIVSFAQTGDLGCAEGAVRRGLISGHVGKLCPAVLAGVVCAVVNLFVLIETAFE